MSTESNAYAFPASEQIIGGLTIREYFAIRSFQAMISTLAATQETASGVSSDKKIDELASNAVRAADALIKRLNAR